MSATPTAEKTQNSDMRRRTLVFLYFTLDRFFVSIENFEKDPSKKKIQRSLSQNVPQEKKNKKQRLRIFSHKYKKDNNKYQNLLS